MKSKYRSSIIDDFIFFVIKGYGLSILGVINNSELLDTIKKLIRFFMKKITFLFVVLLVNCSCFAYDYEYKKFDFNPIVKLYDKNNTITLKLLATSGFNFSSDQYRNFSYIVEINEEIREDCAVYLSVLDPDGFEIEKKFISNIHKNYKGSLKGSFTLQLSESRKISGAEVCYYEIEEKD